MDYRKRFILMAILFVFSVEAMNLYQPRYFCGSLLADTLRKYNCVYHEIKGIDYVEKTGIINECCFNRCSEFDLVKSYCSRSDMDSLPNEVYSTPKVNEIIPVMFDISSEDRKTQRKKHRKVGKRRDESGRNNNKEGRNSRVRAAEKTRKLTAKTKAKRKSKSNTNNKRRNCACTCPKTNKKIKETSLKSPVVGLTNFSLNSVIRRGTVYSSNVMRL